MANDRVSSIQQLRGVAAMMVVFDHVVRLFADRPDMTGSAVAARLGDVAHFGASGVDLFFVISGFVMAHAIGRGVPPSAGDFLARRAIRVLPLFWIMGALYAGWRAWTGDAWPLAAGLNALTIVPLLDGAVYHAPPLYVGWTLGFELCFYLLVAVLLALRPRRPAVALAGLTVAAAAIGLAAPFGWAALAFLFNPIGLEFAFGIAAWIAWRRGIGHRTAELLGCAGLLALVLFLCSDWLPGFSVHYDPVVSGGTSLRRALEWGLPYALIVAGCTALPARSGPVTRATARIGDASYSLYLVHPLTIALVAAAWPAGWSAPALPLGAGLFALAVGSALPLHRFVERPLLAALQRWIAAKGARRATQRPVIA